MTLLPRPQFTLKTMLWLMALVGAFCGGRFSQIKFRQRELDELASELGAAKSNLRHTHARLDLNYGWQVQEQERLREWLRYERQVKKKLIDEQAAKQSTRSAIQE